MNRTGEVVFHLVAVAAAIVLKVLIVATWCGLGLVGVRAWRGRRWAVTAVPVVSFSIVWALILIGNSTIGWWLVGR